VFIAKKQLKLQKQKL